MGYLRCANIVLGACVVLVAGCKREERGFRVSPPAASVIQGVKVSDLQPGPFATNPPVKNEYEENAHALSEGKRLFNSFNCVGCHSNGGGGMGPPLMDDTWLYGYNPEQVYATITQGRPNGMPSFGGKIPEYQVWQLAAYVRSLSGLTPKDASPARGDHMNAGKPESSGRREQPKNSAPLQ